jgi:DMSO/TMAO reductase YedYZ molybdopterin-dependent catalytic subunit
MSEPIISDDVKRDQRIPPGQRQTHKWPVLHYGPTPSYANLDKDWDFHVFGLVKAQRTFSYREFFSLPRVTVHADMHCVTRWSKLDNIWTGVATRELLTQIEPRPEAKYVMVHCEYGFTTNLPLSDFFDEDCLFAMTHGSADLEPDHGYPLRLVVPKLYAWKSAKWVRGIEFMAKDAPGFWERWDHGGYHMRGDPWTEERHRSDDSYGAGL